MREDFEKLIEASKKYIEVRIELLKLDIQEESGKYLMRISFLIFILFLFLFSILFVCLGLAFYLNEVMESHYLGFFIIAGFFFAVCMVIYILRNSRRIINFFKNIIDDFIFD